MKIKKNKKLSVGKTNAPSYNGPLDGVTGILHEARLMSGRVVNSIMTATYWEIGRRIVEYEQEGKTRAEYGVKLLKQMAADLTGRFGRGFGYANVNLFRQFYLAYHKRSPILQTPSKELQPFKLSWSHYVRLLPTADHLKRNFYEEEAISAGWSVRQLDRQMASMLFERTALSRKKAKLIEKTKQGGEGIIPEQAFKDPYILDFLALPESHLEKDLENALITHMTDFLLEMGCGFTFVARQKRLQIGSESFYLDLLLYHRRLRCLIAIDLKIGRL